MCMRAIRKTIQCRKTYHRGYICSQRNHPQDGFFCFNWWSWLRLMCTRNKLVDYCLCGLNEEMLGSDAGSVGCLRCWHSFPLSHLPTPCYIQPHVPFNAWPRHLQHLRFTKTREEVVNVVNERSGWSEDGRRKDDQSGRLAAGRRAILNHVHTDHAQRRVEKSLAKKSNNL
jgi:hypothetical protein